MSIDNLKEELHQQVQSSGAAYFGVADLIPAQKFILEQGNEFLAQFPRAVSFGIPLANAIVGQLYQHENRFVGRSYRHHVLLVSSQLDQIALRTALKIQEEGYQAFPVMATLGYDSQGLRAIFSHKLAAHLAGLGWIGKSCLLVTPDRGVRVRWATVLTDAPLTAKSTIAPERCGKCQACVDICPVHAYTGVAFSPDEPREVRFDVRKCYDYAEHERQGAGYQGCGLCIYACPIGEGHRRKARGHIVARRAGGGRVENVVGRAEQRGHR